MEKRFIAGSFCFFRDMPGFELHDLDYIIVTDEMFKDYHHIYWIEGGIGKDYFYWKKNTPEWHINSLLSEKAFTLDIARLLVPAVAKELGITINMLQTLKPIAEKLKMEFEGKYDYYRIILNAYLENNDFILTDTQRIEAYNSYKNSRK